MQKFSVEQKHFLFNLGQNIRRIRYSKGFTQQHLAALTDTEEANLSRIETGKSNATIGTLKKIADALASPLIDFFSGS